ncbi:MAG: hypothetical protein J6D21_11760 [Clostridia bacterium]|nr:hypothetical protein [Clostridia bacterium]
MLQDFFEANSISLEVFELFEEFCFERAKKPALRAVFRQVKDDYGDEPGEYIIALMSVYYCGLKNHFEDPKFKKELEALTKEQIFACFGEEDGKHIAETLDELLKMPPDPAVRKKIDYSNPGSKNWKVGDLYAYRLRGEEVEKAGLEGKYAVIYCVDVEKTTSRLNEIEFYVFLCDHGTLLEPPGKILRESCIVASHACSKKYPFLLISYHHEYPVNELVYLGNTKEFIHPDDEIVYGTSLAIPRIIWKWFDEKVAKGYLSSIKYLANHRKI